MILRAGVTAGSFERHVRKDIQMYHYTRLPPFPNRMIQVPTKLGDPITVLWYIKLQIQTCKQISELFALKHSYGEGSLLCPRTCIQLRSFLFQKVNNSKISFPSKLLKMCCFKNFGSGQKIPSRKAMTSSSVNQSTNMNIKKKLDINYTSLFNKNRLIGVFK